MKKELVISSIVFVLLAFAIIVAAENLGSQNIPRPIPTFELLGHGVAVLQNNPQEFRLIRVGVARINLFMGPGPTPEDMAIGILWLDHNRYHLRNVVIESGPNLRHIKGEVYKNTTYLGIFDVSLTPEGRRGMTNIWFGTLSITSVERNAYDNYYVYILEPASKIQPKGI